MESARCRLPFSPGPKRSLSVEQVCNRPARFGNGVARLLCALANGTANGPGLFSQPLNALRHLVACPLHVIRRLAGGPFDAVARLVRQRGGFMARAINQRIGALACRLNPQGSLIE